MKPTKNVDDPSDLGRQLQDLRDRALIADLISRFVVAIDRRELRETPDLFTDDFVFEFPAVRSDPANPDAMKQFKGLAPYDRTQHVASNTLIEIEQDHALARADLLAIHVHDAIRPDLHFDLGAFYEFELERSQEGWRFARAKLNPLWTGGVGPGPDVLGRDAPHRPSPGAPGPPAAREQP